MSDKYIQFSGPDATGVIIFQFGNCIYYDGSKALFGPCGATVPLVAVNYLPHVRQLIDMIDPSTNEGAFMAKWSYDGKCYCVEWYHTPGSVQLRMEPVQQ